MQPAPIVTTQAPLISQPPFGKRKKSEFYVMALFKIKKIYFIKEGFLCDFENSVNPFCAWTQKESGATVNWIRKNGLTRPGPKYDQY